MHCPPEIVMEKPCTENRWRWVWSVCQPDAHWAEIYGGSHVDKARACRDAETMLIVATREWEKNAW